VRGLILEIAMQNPHQDLLNKINAAVADHNAAEQAVATAQSELVSKSKVVGQLLLEAKKLHPKVKDFDAFLRGVNGLKLSRAYDLLRLAGGRTTDEELRQETRDRVQKHRAKKKLPQPKPVSVTHPDVTESPKRIIQSPEIDIEQRKAEMAALDSDTARISTLPRSARPSAHALAQFTVACRAWLPKITEPGDRCAAIDAFKAAMREYWNAKDAA
jgi:hypothetical protein